MVKNLINSQITSIWLSTNFLQCYHFGFESTVFEKKMLKKLIFTFLTFAIIKVSESAGNCPSNTIKSYNGKTCFSFNSNITDFYGAENDCVFQGLDQSGHLAFVDSAITNSLLSREFLLNHEFFTHLHNFLLKIKSLFAVWTKCRIWST